MTSSNDMLASGRARLVQSLGSVVVMVVLTSLIGPWTLQGALSNFAPPMREIVQSGSAPAMVKITLQTFEPGHLPPQAFGDWDTANTASQ